MARTRLPERALRLAVQLLLALACSGCGRDPVRSAIQQLEGPPATARKAAMELRLMSRDPVPQLEAASGNPRTKLRIRIQCLEILGDIARRQNDPRIFEFLRKCLHDADPAVRDAAVSGFVGAACEDAVPDLIALKGTADKDLLRKIEKALASTAEFMAREIEKQWNSPEAAAAAYEHTERLGLDRGLMGYSKAKFLEARGRAQEAGAKFDELGVVRRWWVIGPFPNRQGMGFRSVYPPEKETDLDAQYTAGYGTAAWYELDKALPAGMLNFENYFVETDNVVGYALIFLVSAREQPIEIRAGSDDTLTIFLNGATHWSHEQYRGVKYDNDIVDGTLHEGVNTVLFKVCEDWGAWLLIARFTGPGDTPLDGVEITTARPRPAR